MLRRTALLAVLVPVAGVTAVVASASAGAATVTSSNITAPLNGAHYMITDANASPTPMVTVKGTTNGTTGNQVDIRCYTSPYRWNNGPSGVPVAADGSFSVSMAVSTAYGTCILRAVPAGLAGGSNVRPFTGPKITTEWNTSSKITSGPNTGKIYDFYVEYQSANAMNDYCSASCGGLWDSRLSYSDGSSSNYLWYANALLSGNDGGVRSGLQVDGRNAYLPRAARFIFPNNPGFQALSYTASRNATTGRTTIRAVEPVVVCPSNTFPATNVSCPKFLTAGLRLERTIVADDGGRQVHVSDVWRSTDHKAHTVSAHYYQSVQGYDAAPISGPTRVGVKLPWLSSAYQTFTVDKLLAGPTRVPSSIYVRDDTTAPNGSLDWPRGAISFDVAPSKIHRTSNSDFTMQDEGIKVPAGGTKLVRQAFVMGTSESEIAAKAAANQRQINPYRPDALVKTKSAHTYLGNKIYNATGARQSIVARTSRRSTATFDILVQNHGTATDNVKLRGAGGTKVFGVRYYTGTSGGRDITYAVTHGSYALNGLAPGQWRIIRLVVTVRSGASVGSSRSWLVLGWSTHDGSRKDAVKATVRVR